MCEVEAQKQVPANYAMPQWCFHKKAVSDMDFSSLVSIKSLPEASLTLVFTQQ